MSAGPCKGSPMAGHVCHSNGRENGDIEKTGGEGCQGQERGRTWVKAQGCKWSFFFPYRAFQRFTGVTESHV